MSNVRIRSTEQQMSAYLPRQTRVDWLKGSHTAHVYMGHDAYAYDVFTFAFDKNRTDMLDFTSSLENWMKDNA